MVEFQETTPGLFRAHYRTAADLAAEQQARLIDAVTAAAARGPPV
jgi:hypothetical protein